MGSVWGRIEGAKRAAMILALVWVGVLFTAPIAEAAPSAALVKDIFPGTSGSGAGSLTDVDGTLYFAANDGSSGLELWRSDGTPAGTALVKDISPGSGGSGPSGLTNVSGTLYFTANDATNGVELW